MPFEANAIERSLAMPADRRMPGAHRGRAHGAIGESSMFHDTFGYYAQGVLETTAVLPTGWRARLACSISTE